MSAPSSERLPGSKVFSHLAVMVAVSVVMGVVVAGLAIPFAGVLGFGARNASEAIDDLPKELETGALPQRTKIVDAAGNTIATVFDENRVNVALPQISRTMVKAIVAIEDYRYYQHGALDLKGTLRALLTNQASADVVQGGSSITQQMVKLTLLSQAKTDEERKAATDDTYARKLRELRYAIAVEDKYSKDWILERYLNIAYFGDGAYGIQAAARHYFNVNAKDLDLKQSAMLAGLVQNPTQFDPTNSPEGATERRNVVLDRMAQLNVITRERAVNIKAQPLGLDTQPSRNGCVNSRAPFFCDYVLQYLMKDPSLGKTTEDRRNLIYAGGLTIKTTIDLRHQRAADAAVRNGVYATDEAIGALALVEPRSGEVKAIAQSRPMGRDRKAGETYLNYVVPERYGDSKGFQPGSTFKAFVLATAIKQGISLNTSIKSPQQVFIPFNRFETCDGPYLGSDVYDPKNSTGAGTFDLYSGTRLSVNTFFVQLEERTGICEPYTLAKEMGVELTDPVNEIVPSFTLGVADVSPLEMAEAYATFAGRGLHCSSRPVTLISDPNGNQLKKYRPQCQQVMSGPVADAVNDVLRGVIESGGFAAAQYPGQPAAGKTGTTNSNLSVWFAGYTPNLAGAAVVAGAEPNGNQRSLDGVSIAGAYRSTSGSTTAGPIWGDAFKAIAPTLPDDSFTSPSGSDIEGLQYPIPDVDGESYDDAVAELEGAGFVVSTGELVDSSYSRGSVAYTYPAGGDELAAGDTVVIYRSDGTPPGEGRKQKKGKRGRD